MDSRPDRISLPQLKKMFFDDTVAVEDTSPAAADQPRKVGRIKTRFGEIFKSKRNKTTSNFAPNDTNNQSKKTTQRRIVIVKPFRRKQGLTNKRGNASEPNVFDGNADKHASDQKHMSSGMIKDSASSSDSDGQWTSKDDVLNQSFSTELDQSRDVMQLREFLTKKAENVTVQKRSKSAKPIFKEKRRLSSRAGNKIDTRSQSHSSEEADKESGQRTASFLSTDDDKSERDQRFRSSGEDVASWQGTHSYTAVSLLIVLFLLQNVSASNFK